MCVIVIIKNQKQKRYFLNNILKPAINQNPDGQGIAFIRNNKIKIIKGFFSVKDIENIIYKNKLNSFIFHSRIATYGQKSIVNCHPFLVEKKSASIKSCITEKPVLFHNGSISIEKFLNFPEILKNLPDNFSDSYLLARLIAVYGFNISNLFPGNKIAVLYPSGKILITGNFSQDNGIFVSNLSYKYTYKGNSGLYVSQKFNPDLYYQNKSGNNPVVDDNPFKDDNY